MTELESVISHFLYTLDACRERGMVRHLIDDPWFVRISHEDAYQAGYDDAKAGLSSELEKPEAFDE